MTGGRIEHDDVRAAELARRFAGLHGHAPDGVWRAPGRVNLIGEHTDYNDGLALPFATDRSAMVAVRLRRDGGPGADGSDVVELASTHAPDGSGLSRSRFRTGELAPGAVAGWGAYPAGVVHVLGSVAGAAVPGFELLLDSTVPVGAGRSSSHAVEVATMVALNNLLGLGLKRTAMVRLTQRAENEFVGAPIGILDQSASLPGRAGAALFPDCRTLEAEAVPLPLAEQGLVVLVVDTKVAHSHAENGYCAPRATCERGAAALDAASSRDVAEDADLARLDPRTARRVRHVLTENRRVLETVVRLRAGDVAGSGSCSTHRTPPCARTTRSPAPHSTSPWRWPRPRGRWGPGWPAAASAAPRSPWFRRPAPGRWPPRLPGRSRRPGSVPRGLRGGSRERRRPGSPSGPGRRGRPRSRSRQGSPPRASRARMAA